MAEPLPSMHEPSALSPESHTHAQGGWKKEGLRGGHERERKLVQIPEKNVWKFPQMNHSKVFLISISGFFRKCYQDISTRIKASQMYTK